MHPTHATRVRPGRQLVAPVLLAGLAACSAPPPPAPPPPEVGVSRPVRRDVVHYAEFVGKTASTQRAEIRARVPGFLERMAFTPSQMVARGQLLFVIEPAPYRAQKDRAEAALRSAEANAERAASDLERLEVAVKTNAVSQQDVTRARAELAQAEAAVLSSRAQLAEAEIQLGYTDVRSPVAGMVGRNLVDTGNLVGQGQATLLTTVTKLDPLFVYFELPEDIVLRVREDLRASGVSLDARDEAAREKTRFFVGTAVDEGFPWEGNLDFISNSVDAGTGTIEVRGVVANPDHVLLPGVFVRVRVPGRLIDDAVLVEERAVGTDLAGKYVMVVNAENVVEQVRVELGPLQDDGFVTVLSGLEGDEEYVVDGVLRARPGLPVTPVRDAAGAAG